MRPPRRPTLRAAPSARPSPDDRRHKRVRSAAPAATGARRPARPTFHLGLVAGLGLVFAGVVAGGMGDSPTPAGAVVVHDQGFEATVLGWSSWYGSYGIGPLGVGWCIDHGLRAPDPDLIYSPTSIDGETDPDTQAAMAWAATVNAPTDPVATAATMFALHDLRRASYPFGFLDVDSMSAANLANFHGHEDEVLARARSIKAEARAHAHLRAPFSLRLEATVASTGATEMTGSLVVSLVDANGAPVPGVAIGVEAPGSSLGPSLVQNADGAGRATFTFVRPVGAANFAAGASIPDTRPHLWGSTTAPAQRIIQPARLDVRADASIAPPPTTTPPTTAPSTTTPPTTAPPTTVAPTTATPTTTPPTTAASTTTTRPATTSTRPPMPSTSTTRPTTPAPSTTTTAIPTITSTPAASTTTTTTTSTTSTSSTSTTATTSAAPPAPGPVTTFPSRIAISGSLPVTGAPSGALALIGSGAVLLGSAFMSEARGRRTSTTTR